MFIFIFYLFTSMVLFYAVFMTRFIIIICCYLRALKELLVYLFFMKGFHMYIFIFHYQRLWCCFVPPLFWVVFISCFFLVGTLPPHLFFYLRVIYVKIPHYLFTVISAIFLCYLIITAKVLDRFTLICIIYLN